MESTATLVIEEKDVLSLAQRGPLWHLRQESALQPKFRRDQRRVGGTSVSSLKSDGTECERAARGVPLVDI